MVWSSELLVPSSGESWVDKVFMGYGIPSPRKAASEDGEVKVSKVHLPISARDAPSILPTSQGHQET